MSDIPQTSEAAGYPSNDWQATAERLFECSAKLERQLTGLRDAARYAESVFRAHNECRDHSLGMEKAVERLAAALANTKLCHSRPAATVERKGNHE